MILSKYEPDFVKSSYAFVSFVEAFLVKFSMIYRFIALNVAYMILCVTFSLVDVTYVILLVMFDVTFYLLICNFVTLKMIWFYT